jgi:hypothetical protein
MNTDQINAIIASLIRKALVSAGVAGYVKSDSEVAQIASAVAVIISVAWGIIKHYVDNKAQPISPGVPVLPDNVRAYIDNASKTTRTMLMLLPMLWLCGCASISGETTAPDGSKTKFHGFSFWDSHNDLAKAIASQVTTNRTHQSVGITGLAQDSSTTNLNNLVSEVVSAALKAVVKP